MSDKGPVHWMAENLRLSAFTKARCEPDSLVGTWEATVKEEPESVERKPKEHIVRESGDFREASLTFACTPHRIDWIMHQAKEMPETWSLVGGFTEECRAFGDLMEGWLPQCPTLDRLAFGAVLLHPMDSRAECYEKVSQFLPFDVDCNAKNFTYQINRPRETGLGIPDLVINRLSKWACLEMRQLSIKQRSSIEERSLDNFAVRLELDVNTVPEYTVPLNTEILTELFRELVEMGSEIAENGDKP